MLKLFYAPTPPNLRVILLLEELKLDYKSFPINVFKKETLNPEYANIVPTKKVPAIFDNGELFFDSANILLHLAQKYNKLMPKSLSWFFWGVSELNPKFMQLVAEIKLGNTNVDTMDKIKEQLRTLLVVLNEQLDNKGFLEDNTYSIADINVYATIKMYLLREVIGDVIAPLVKDLSNINRWIANIDKRDASQKMFEITDDFNKEAISNKNEITNFYNS